MERRVSYLVFFKHGPEPRWHIREAAGCKISYGAVLFLLLLIYGPLDVPLLLLDAINFFLLVISK